MLKDKKSEKELLELFRQRKSDRKSFRAQFKKRKRGAPEKASSLLNSFFKDTPDALRKMQESQAIEAWHRYVGKEAALVSRALKIKEGELTVVVSDTLWLHQLLLLKNEILKCYRRDFPQLKLFHIFLKRGNID
jgi:hypothetical protein